jgi:hypothetical protein
LKGLEHRTSIDDSNKGRGVWLAASGWRELLWRGQQRIATKCMKHQGKEIQSRKFTQLVVSKKVMWKEMWVNTINFFTLIKRQCWFMETNLLCLWWFKNKV